MSRFNPDFRAVFDAAPDALIVFDQGARIRFANAQVEDLFGYDQSELVEAGGLSISTEPVDVLQVIDEVRTTLEPAAQDKSVGIELVSTEPTLPMVSVDRVRFAQILMNFGSNAIKYNRRDGSLTFVVSVPSDERLRVAVADSGIGIPLDKQHLVFQPFQRAGQEGGAIEGTGIGLAITKRLAELMGGEVGFSSTLGEGSEFWVEVPVHASMTRSSVPPGVALRAVRSGGERERALVLYVEDNPANVTFMEQFFESFDRAELLIARSAVEGVRLARARRPDLVIIDINLPGMSGLEALSVLRGWPETSSIPVVALSAAATIQDRNRGERAGFHRYLTKPVKVADLESTLTELLAW